MPKCGILFRCPLLDGGTTGQHRRTERGLLYCRVSTAHAPSHRGMLTAVCVGVVPDRQIPLAAIRGFAKFKNTQKLDRYFLAIDVFVIIFSSASLCIN